MQRPLLLNGFMGSGKSSIGPLVAARAGRKFVDLDQAVEARAGRSVSQIFAERQEAGFRQLEREVLAELLAGSPEGAPPVIALGGGALAARATRLWALDQAVVVTLVASPGETLRRVGNGATRPLLAGFLDAQARIEELLELRQRAYAEAHARVSTDGRSRDAIADAVLEVWTRDPLAVAAGEHSYSVEISRSLFGRLAALTAGASRVIVVSDKTVWGLHGAAALQAFAGVPAPVVIELEPGEEHKRVDAVERIWRVALANGADRSSVFVALGGGVVSDITGFAAATYMRGVPWICLPTTLLAMVDASVGGKTGVDLEAAKNAVGAFHQPRAVLCDVDRLATEPERGFRGALAEVVKTALIGDRALLERLESDGEKLLARDPELLTDLVRRSIRVKARIVSQDERESGLRAVLNLGHTIGHAFEAHAGYGRLSHGEAISLGLVAALRVGVRLNSTEPSLAARVESLLERLRLPVDLAAEPVSDAVELVGHDKKRAGKRLRFVVARAVERVEVVELELERVKQLAREVAHPHP